MESPVYNQMTSDGHKSVDSVLTTDIIMIIALSVTLLLLLLVPASTEMLFYFIIILQVTILICYNKDITKATALCLMEEASHVASVSYTKSCCTK